MRQRARAGRNAATAVAGVVMAVAFSGCDVLQWATCVAYGTVCGRTSPEPTVSPPENPPAPPTDLTATPGDGEVTLSWTPSVTEDVTHYEIVRRAEGDTTIVFPPQQGRTTSRFVDRGLTNGRTYFYKVYSDNRRARSAADVTPEVAVTPRAGATGLEPLLQIGSPGSGPGQLDSPTGIAVGPSGDVYVVDQGNHRIQRFSPSGEVRGAWGTAGEGAGQFQRPHGVAVDAGGFVYVTDTEAENVQKFTSAGTFVSIWTQAGPGDPIRAPKGIAIGHDGDVFVGSGGSRGIYRFTPEGDFLAGWGDIFDTSQSMVWDAGALATDFDGSVYYTDILFENHAIKSDGLGNHRVSWGRSGTGDGEFDTPMGITISSGRVFVADTGNNRIQEFDTDGVFRGRFGSAGTTMTQFDAPQGLASDCRGRLYVADAGNDRVLVFGPPESDPPPCDSEAPSVVAATPRSFLVMTSASSRFRATLTTSSVAPGRLTAASGRVSERGFVARGRFTGQLAGGRRGLSVLAPFSRGGTWRSSFDVTADATGQKGTARGYTLAIARRKSGGRVCMSFRTSFSIAGGRVRANGTFRTRGGSRAGAKLAASGRFRQTYRAGGSFAVGGSGKAREAKARRMPAPCRRLARMR